MDANQTERKSFAVLKTSTWASAQADPTGTPAGTTVAKLIVPNTDANAQMKLTPKTDFDFDKWDPNLPQDNNTLISAITGVVNNKITFVAKFTKRGDLVTPTISQDVQDFDGTNEKKVVKVSFTNTPTEGSKAQLVKVGKDGFETNIGEEFDPTNGDSLKEIIETEGNANRLVDGDKVKVKVTKAGSSPKYSNEIELDLAAPVFSDLKVERTADYQVKITGKVTDAKHDIGWVKCGNAKGKLTPVDGDNKVQTFEITVLVKEGQNKYQLVAKDVLANKSKDDDQSNQVEDTTNPSNVPKGVSIELRQPYEEQTTLVVWGEKDNKVVAYKYDNQGKRVFLGKTVINNKRGTITVPALTKWERVYVVVLDKNNEASYDSLDNTSLDAMNFGINPPTSMIVWSQINEEMPTENPVNPAGTGVAGGEDPQVQ